MRILMKNFEVILIALAESSKREVVWSVRKETQRKSWGQSVYAIYCTSEQSLHESLIVFTFFSSDPTCFNATALSDPIHCSTQFADDLQPTKMYGPHLYVLSASQALRNAYQIPSDLPNCLGIT